MTGGAPAAIQEESGHARFAFRGATDSAGFLLVFAFKHTQDVSESDRNQNRLNPLWIGYSCLFELKCIAFPVFMHYLDAKALAIEFISSVGVIECRCHSHHFFISFISFQQDIHHKIAVSRHNLIV